MNTGLGFGLGVTDVHYPGNAINLTDNLMAYWDIEANGNDSGPRSNHMTGINTPTFVAGGKPNNAANLIAASTQYFEMANNGDVVLFSTDFTLTAWAKLASGGGLRRIFGKGNTSSPVTFEYALYYNNASRFAFSVGNGVAVTTVTDTAVSVSTGVWYFVVARYSSAAQQISISVNNNTPVTASFTSTVLSGGNTLRLGNDPAGVSRLWDGNLDSLGIWKKYLSAAEVTALYNAGAGRAYSQF